MKRAWVAALAAVAATAQTQPRQVARLLEAPLISPDVAAFQLRQYLLAKAPKLPAASATWEPVRRRVLEDVVFHGWPREWVEGPLKYEDAGEIPAGPGYRMRKLRYEIVPGFQATAILYEPDPPRPQMPAILNVNGHVGAPGKAIEYKQKRCIHQARQGIVALNLEWLAFGELASRENQHWFAAHLDLVGANGLGLFYLAMRKGLDILERHPRVDRARLGVTGLSGGGWQTIVLGALDPRVAVAVPVAGYASLLSRLERTGDIGDLEQNATDLLAGQDYPHLTAMRAPKPTLLIYNAEDDCCFRAPLVKPYIFDALKPWYQALAWHENTDPSDHNYQRDNRLQSYRFFARHFGLPEVRDEIQVDAEIKSVEELRVGLPPDNLTILGLARKLAAGIRREPGGRDRLARVVRYRPVEVRQAWALDNTKRQGFETRSYRFDFSDGLQAGAVWLRAADPPTGFTIVLHDDGRKAAAAEVSDRVNRGEQVLAVEPMPISHLFAQMVAATGERPLGILAAQVAALARWQGGKPRLEVSGFRSQAVALAAAALHPGLFKEVVVHDGKPSLAHLLDAPVEYQAAPELFCLDLYKEFDLDRLAELAR